MNVNLWFARDNNGEIISVVDSNESNTYVCPICNSDVIPKALTSVKVSPHFAHIDKTKCDSESMLHFWFKYKFIERGDTFTIKTDKEYTFTCKDYSVEKQFNLESGIYRPDLLVTTECGNEIVFEMANTNKKKVQDYIDRWIELDKIVVEVDIKSLQGNEKVFNALYYNGKCFNFNKRDGGYYKTIGKLKEEMGRNGEYDIELVKKLDWFWKELNNNDNIEELFLFLKNLTKVEFDLFSNMSHTKIKELLHKYHAQVLDGFVHYMDDIYKKTKIFKLENIKFKKDHFTIIIKNISFPNKCKITFHQQDSLIRLYNKITNYFINSVNSMEQEVEKERFKREVYYHLNEHEIKYIEDNDSLGVKVKYKDYERVKYYVCGYLKSEWVNTLVEYENAEECANKLKEFLFEEESRELLHVYREKSYELLKLIELDETIKGVIAEFENRNKGLKVEILEKNLNKRTIRKQKSLNETCITIKVLYKECTIGKIKHEMNFNHVDALLKDKLKSFLDENYYVKAKENQELHVYLLEMRESLLNRFSKYKEVLNFWVHISDVKDLKYRLSVEIIRNKRYEKEYIFNNKEEYTLEEIMNTVIESIEKSTCIECRDCESEFKLNIKELDFYISKGFDLPRRCKSCRQKRKQNR